MGTTAQRQLAHDVPGRQHHRALCYASAEALRSCVSRCAAESCKDLTYPPGPEVLQVRKGCPCTALCTGAHHVNSWALCCSCSGCLTDTRLGMLPESNEPKPATVMTPVPASRPVNLSSSSWPCTSDDDADCCPAELLRACALTLYCTGAAIRAALQVMCCVQVVWQQIIPEAFSS